MKILKVALLALSTVCVSTSVLAGHHAGSKGYALAEDGKTLAVMSDLAKPGAITSYSLSRSLSAIAYRPVTGDLLGFSDGAIYSIDAKSGKLSSYGAKFMGDAVIGSSAMVGFDFNNKIDAVRVVSSSGDNLVYFPVGFGNNDTKANTVRRFASLAYAKDDTNSGVTPEVFANAYTNAINGKKASGTFQYALDAATDSLVSLANNAGTLKTIGKVKIGGKAVDISAMGGFDIVSKAEGKDTAYAVLQLEGESTSGLYGINLKTAEASLIAKLGLDGITSFAASKSRSH